MIGFDVDDFMVDLFYYFVKSTKRKAELAGMLLHIPFHYVYVDNIMYTSNHVEYIQLLRYKGNTCI